MRLCICVYVCVFVYVCNACNFLYTPESLGRYQPVDMQRLWEDDGFVASYLEAKHHAVGDAVKMIDESLQWRKEFSVNGAVANSLTISFDFFFDFFLRVIKILLLHQGICFIANEITPIIIKLYATLRRVSPKSKQCYCALLIYKRRQPNVDADRTTMGQAVK